jgi:hypothetical protein
MDALERANDLGVFAMPTQGSPSHVEVFYVVATSVAGTLDEHLMLGLGLRHDDSHSGWADMAVAWEHALWLDGAQ